MRVALPLLALASMSQAALLRSRQSSTNSSTCTSSSPAGTDCRRFRFVPALVNASLAGANWLQAPPSGFQYGNFFLGYTNQPAYLLLNNLQNAFYPILPTSNTSVVQQIDLTSFEVGNSSTLTTTFAIDTIVGNIDDHVFYYNVSGGRSGYTSYGFLGWGWDESGNGYFLDYTAASASLNLTTSTLALWSRVQGGPDNSTVTAVKNCIAQLSSPELTSLVNSIVKAPNNGRRTGQPVFCDALCQNNTAA